MIRVLLVEDSAVQREFLRFILEESGKFEVVGVAVDGEDGVAQAERLRPDIVLMDCHMPKLDGIAATRMIMKRCPMPIVIASANSGNGDVQLSFEAIRSGALAVVGKPPGIASPDFEQGAAELVRTLELMSEVEVVRRWESRAPQAAGPTAARAAAPAADSRTVRAIAIVGSTGAPGVIAEILTGIAAPATPPVLIVQHISAGFIAGFAQWLARSGLNVQIAQAGVRLLPGQAYVAPDDAQLAIDARGTIVLDGSAEPESGFRPSGSVLLRSVAQRFGRDAIGIVLTGMGRDGAAGLAELRAAGGVTVAQDEESSVVFGMPREAIAAGAEHVLSPEGIVQLIKSYCAGPSART